MGASVESGQREPDEQSEAHGEPAGPRPHELASGPVAAARGRQQAVAASSTGAHGQDSQEARRLATLVRQSGGNADIERPTQSLARRREDGSIREAIMDVLASWPSVLQRWHIDVTIRSPISERYAAATLHPQKALKQAAADKKARYGRGVVAIAVGVLGRRADASLQHIEAMTAAAVSVSRGGSAEQSGAMARRWRDRLQRVQSYAYAESTALALGSAFQPFSV